MTSGFSLAQSTSPACPARQRGLALMLVIFVVALSSILVVNLAYNTTLGAYRISYTQRAIEAEYLLRSALVVARLLITDPGTGIAGSSRRSPWGQFADGAELPPELFPTSTRTSSIPQQRARVSLEIRPEDAKLPLRNIMGGTTPDAFWVTSLTNLMINLGFDQDNEVEDSGPLRGRHVTSAELVGLIVDLLDPDTTSHNPSLGETDLPKDLFPPSFNLTSLSQLSRLPGFTESRLRMLAPFVTTADVSGGGGNGINVNFAPLELLTALQGMAASDAANIVAFRDSPQGPFNQANIATELGRLAPSFTSTTRLIATSNKFSVVSKVEFGSGIFFMRAVLTGGAAPSVDFVEYL